MPGGGGRQRIEDGLGEVQILHEGFVGGAEGRREQAQQGRHDVLGQADVGPVVVELPDIEEEDVGGLCQRLCLLDGADSEPQHHVVAIAGDQWVVGRVGAVVGARAGRAQAYAVVWKPPDALDNGVRQPSPGPRRVRARERGAGSIVGRLEGGRGQDEDEESKQAQDSEGAVVHGGGRGRGSMEERCWRRRRRRRCGEGGGLCLCLCLRRCLRWWQQRGQSESVADGRRRQDVAGAADVAGVADAAEAKAARGGSGSSGGGPSSPRSALHPLLPPPPPLTWDTGWPSVASVRAAAVGRRVCCHPPCALPPPRHRLPVSAAGCPGTRPPLAASARHPRACIELSWPSRSLPTPFRPHPRPHHGLALPLPASASAAGPAATLRRLSA